MKIKTINLILLNLTAVSQKVLKCKVAILLIGVLVSGISNVNLEARGDQGMKAGLGVMSHQPRGSLTYGTAGEYEFFPLKRFGITAGFGFDLITDKPEATSSYFSNGINTHLFPDSDFDFYIGGRGALTNIAPKGLDASINPTINLYAGTSVYFDSFVVDLEAGYAIFGYGNSGNAYISFASPRVYLRLGYMFDLFAESKKVLPKNSVDANQKSKL